MPEAAVASSNSGGPTASAGGSAGFATPEPGFESHPSGRPASRAAPTNAVRTRMGHLVRPCRTSPGMEAGRESAPTLFHIRSGRKGRTTHPTMAARCFVTRPLLLAFLVTAATAWADEAAVVRVDATKTV